MGALEERLPNVLPPGVGPPSDPNVGVLLDADPIAPNVGLVVLPKTGADPNVEDPPNAGVAPKAGPAPNAEGAGVVPGGEPPNVGAAPNAGAPGFAGVDGVWLIPKP